MKHEHDLSRVAVKQPEHERTASECASDALARCRGSLATLQDDVTRRVNAVLDDLGGAAQAVVASATKCRADIEAAISRARDVTERALRPDVHPTLAEPRDAGGPGPHYKGVAAAIDEFTSALGSESARLATEVGDRLDAGANADIRELFEWTGARAKTLEADLQIAIAQRDPLDVGVRFVDGAVRGDFSDDQSTSATIGRIVGGLIPVADVRDVAAGVTHVVEEKEGAWLDLAMAAVGAVPVAGDAVKVLGRVGRDVLEEGTEKVVKSAAHEAAEARQALRGASHPPEIAERWRDVTDDEIDRLFDRWTEMPEGSAEYLTDHVARTIGRGNEGEYGAALRTSMKGHTVVAFKPNIGDTTKNGIDLVTIGPNGRVFLIDNKAYSRGGSIGEVTSLTGKTFIENRRRVLEDLDGLAKNDDPLVRRVMQYAADAIRHGNYTKVVTNANATIGPVLRDVTEKLRTEQGIEFIDVMREAVKDR